YGGKIQAQEVMSQSSFYSANDSRLHFGLGMAESADLEIRWTSGARESVGKVAAGQLVTIREGAGIVKSVRFGAA
ncbi:MAG: ASPIC/UnbV domain-containing protein, partial [Acidobacteriota bacterium]|nr:ASPIC/UnbV domain-containing protein [Acidobacteriota bacterium]